MAPTLLLLTLALAPADGCAAPDGPPPPAAVRVEDLSELQGEWEVVSVVRGGVAVLPPKGERWSVTGHRFKRANATGQQFQDPALSVDIYSDSQGIVEAECRSGFGGPFVYRRAGDVLLWAMHASGGGPLTFEPGPGVTIRTLRRVKK